MDLVIATGGLWRPSGTRDHQG